MNRLLTEQYGPGHVAFLHETNPWSTERLVRLCNEQGSPIRAISGHYPFGIHQLLERPCTYFTYFRHPIELLVSMYYYIRRTPVIPAYQLVAPMSFREFAESPHLEHLTANLQTKYVAGMSERFEHKTGLQYFSWHPGNLAPDLAQAKENLRKHFSFAGITEWFFASVAPLSKALGWSRLVQPSYENVTANRPRVAEVDPHAILILMEKNQLDFQLYEHAKALYREYAG